MQLREVKRKRDGSSTPAQQSGGGHWLHAGRGSTVDAHAEKGKAAQAMILASQQQLPEELTTAILVAKYGSTFTKAAMNTHACISQQLLLLTFSDAK